jgi:pseudouridine-5'-phosphate glycosidase/pseudouridine kinase
VLASGASGATTVAGTMIAAEMARIAVFVTGGIGGVHRGAETTFDVSADLAELGRTPVLVVCAGVKSILNIAATLEVLETQGVPVLTLAAEGAPDDFPAFFSPRSGVRSPERVATPEAAANMLRISRALGLRNGFVLAVPNPAPAGSEAVETATTQALSEARAAGVEGRDVTPFLLKRVSELTGGATLEANLALIKHNAGVGARVAVELARLEREGAGSAPSAAPRRSGAARAKLPSGKRSFSTRAAPAPPGSDVVGAAPAPPAKKRAKAVPKAPKTAPAAVAASVAPPAPQALLPAPLFVGGAVLDVLCRPLAGSEIVPATSNPGSARQSVGGVARNVGEVFARLDRAFGAVGGGSARVGAPTLVTAVAQDPAGAAIATHCAAAGLEVRGVLVPGGRSPTYVALLDGKGDLLAAVADMEAFDALTPAALGLTAGSAGTAAAAAAEAPAIDAAALVLAARRFFVVADANLSPATLAALARSCAAAGAPLVFEPISVAKCVRIVEARALPLLALLKPNRLEAHELARAERLRRGLPKLARGDDAAAARTLLAAMVDGGVGAALECGDGGGNGGDLKHVVVTLGAEGVLWLSAPCSVARASEARDALLTPEPSAARLQAAGVTTRRLPASSAAFVKATGAGDALLGSLLWASSARGGKLGFESALAFALEAAKAAVESNGDAVPRDLEERMRGAWDAARRAP